MPVDRQSNSWPGKGRDMKTIGRIGIVITTLLSLLLATGCSDEAVEPTRDKDRHAALLKDTMPARKAKSEKYLALDLANGVTMKLVLVPAGKFTMGPPKRGRQVAVSRPFFMGVTEVTQAHWKAVMNTEPWKKEALARSGDNYAANCISWNDATAFCKALSKKTGRAARLPTEAEWEYACRAGATTAYSFGDDESRLGDYAWYSDNAYGKDEKYAHAVGVKKPNAWGLYDMHGNVWEWCTDLPAKGAGASGPKSPTTGKSRVFRGGSWHNGSRRCLATSRYEEVPGIGHGGSGFRVVVEIASP